MKELRLRDSDLERDPPIQHLFRIKICVNTMMPILLCWFEITYKTFYKYDNDDISAKELWEIHNWRKRNLTKLSGASSQKEENVRKLR